MSDYRFVKFGAIIVAICLLATLFAMYSNQTAAASASFKDEACEVVEVERLGPVPENATSINAFPPELILYLDELVDYGFDEGSIVEDYSNKDTTVAEGLDAYALSKDEINVESRVSVDLMIQAKKEEARIRRAEEDAKEYADLDWIKAHLDRYYTEEEIRQTTQIIMAEDLVAYSDTVWSAHAWVIVGRVGAPGFANNDTIIGVLSAKNQFSTYTTANLSVEPDPRVEWVVRDVFARKVLEDMGAPEWEVGRTVPKTHLFFDNRDDNPYYNEFYRYCWGDIYDPFNSPYNPYDN